MKARGIRKQPGQMNGLETRYSQVLEARKSSDVEWWAFEAIKLRLAKKTFYTPDFLVMLKDGTLEVHEVKGFWEDDARVKIKVAASLFPFRFFGKTYSKREGWKTEEFSDG